MAFGDQWLARLRGTFKSLFQLGGTTGVNLKNNSANLDIRNAADSAFANASLDTLKLVDPATPTRSVGLQAPTLPSGTGYSMKFPTSGGSNNNLFKSDGAGGTKWQANSTGVYDLSHLTSYGSLWYTTNANGDPEFFSQDSGNSFYMAITPYSGYVAPDVGNTGSTVYFIKVGDSTTEKLWDTSLRVWRSINWRLIYNSPKISGGLDFSSTWGNQNPFVPQDIFMYWDGANSVAKIYVVPWGPAPGNKTITGVTNASPPVVTVGASHGWSVNDLVVIQDIAAGTMATALNNKLFRVIATAATTISLGNLNGSNVAAPGAAYTSGGKAWKVSTSAAMAPDIATSYDTGNYGETGPLFANLGPLIGGTVFGKYMGTVCYGEAKNTLYDTMTRPFVYNFYNQVARPVGTVDYSSSSDVHVGLTLAATGYTERAAMNDYGPCRQWLLIGRENRNPINLKLRLWRVSPAQVVSSGHTMWLSKNAVAAYNPSSPLSFSPTIIPRAIIHSDGNSGEYETVEVDAQPYERLGLFGYWQAMENGWANAIVTWNLYSNYPAASFGSYQVRGGFFGSVWR